MEERYKKDRRKKIKNCIKELKNSNKKTEINIIEINERYREKIDEYNINVKEEEISEIKREPAIPLIVILLDKVMEQNIRENNSINDRIRRNN